jgi:ferredoxin
LPGRRGFAVGLSIEIDRERCMGSGNCGFFAPATFDLDEELKAVVVGDGDPDEQVLLAADGCPTRAITVRRDGVVVFPT